MKAAAISSFFTPGIRICLCTFVLGLFGLLTIASSLYSSVHPLYLVFRQLSFLCAGTMVMLVCSRIRFQFWLKHTPVFALIFCLLLLLLPFSAAPINNMRGWYRLGGLYFQPSETGRAFFLLMLVVLFCRDTTAVKKLFPVLFFAGFWMLLICLQPDFGMVLTCFLAFLLVCYIAGTPLKYLALFCTGALAGAVGVCWYFPYVLRRFSGFFSADLDPFGKGWHVRQFEFAVARGGWSGSKIGGAVWSNSYLPYSHNDSAGAAMIETLGAAGSLIPALFFLILVFTLRSMALKQNISKQAQLYIAGCAIVISLQVFIHMGINLTLLPPTGLNLPFISYGGSSLTGYFLMLGIALSAARSEQQDQF